MTDKYPVASHIQHLRHSVNGNAKLCMWGWNSRQELAID